MWYMKKDITAVIGIYDIDRERKGDGRRMSDYVSWLKKTMQLNIPMVIYCERSVYEEIKEVRLDYECTKFIIIEKKDIEYLKYEEKVKKIVKDEEYLNKIQGRERLEVKLPNYNLLIMNKMEWLNDVACMNYFGSKFFMWIDAGCSRFFGDYDLSLKKEWPNMDKLNESKFNIQINPNLNNKMDINNLMYRGDHYTTATIFSGTKDTINILKRETELVFKYMIDHNCINNEQIVFAIIYQKYSELFNSFINTTDNHLPYFEYLST